MPDDERHPDGDEQHPDEAGDAAEHDASEAEAEGDAAGDAAESDASEAEAEGDAEGDAAEREASEAEAQGDDAGDAAEREASEAEAAETAGDAAERRAAEEEVREAEKEEDEFGVDQRRMPFTHHLIELRHRILICMGTVGGAFFLFFFLLRKWLYYILTLPVRRACAATNGAVPYEDLLVSLTPTEMFVTSAYFCLFAAIALTIPVTVYQGWLFVRPGLKKKERGAIVPIMSVGTVLFLLGVTFGYLLVVPLALRFLMMDAAKFEGMKLLWNIGKTLKFVTLLLLVFGLAFEMPLVVTALTRVGLISPEMLARKRKHCIVAMFIIGALLTPPDVVTQVCLAVPLVILFEISIVAAKFFKPKRTIWEGWDETDPEDPLGKDWDEAVAATPRSTATTAEPKPEPSTGEAAEHDESGEDDYYDEYGEYYDEDTYEDSMGDDIGPEEEEEGGPADEVHGEDAQPDEEVTGDEEPPAEEKQDGDEPSDEAPPTEDKPQ